MLPARCPCLYPCPVGTRFGAGFPRPATPMPTGCRVGIVVGADGPEEAMGEANVPAKYSEASQESRVPPPDVDPSGPGHSGCPPAQGPRPALGLIWRIRDRDTFVALRQSRRRARRGPVTVTWIDAPPPPRVAYAVGRRAGSAVVRNRIRRRLRAAVRLDAAAIRPGAYLVGATSSAASLPFPELRTSLREAMTAASEQ